MAKAPSPAREARALPAVKKQLRKWYSGVVTCLPHFITRLKLTRSRLSGIAEKHHHRGVFRNASCSRDRGRLCLGCFVISWYWAASYLAVALVGAGAGARARAATPRQHRFSPCFCRVAGRRIESVELFYPCNGASAAADRNRANRSRDYFWFRSPVHA